MKHLIIGIAISFATITRGNEINTVMLLEEYHLICSNAIFQLQTGSSDNTVSNADDVYLVGWLHANEAIPLLFDIIDNPPREQLQTFVGERGAAITTPRSMPPLPPALGALLLLDFPLETITNAITVAGADESRSRTLVKLGQQKYAGIFESLLDSLSATGDTVWQNAARFLEEDPFYRGTGWIQDRSRHFPQNVVTRYKEIFWTFRMAAEEAEKQGDEPLFSEMCNALSEIGHPFDEDRSLWPW